MTDGIKSVDGYRVDRPLVSVSLIGMRLSFNLLYMYDDHD